MCELPGAESYCAKSQVKKMKDDEGHHQNSTPAHHPGCERCFDIALDIIFNRARSPAHTTELDCGGDMKSNTNEKDRLHHPKQLSLVELTGPPFTPEALLR